MKQTAVEKLVSNIRALAYDKRHHLGMGDIRITQGLLDELEEQAKEMEKEQMIKFAKHCLDKALDLDIRTAFSNVEKYYNEKFKSE